MVRETRQRVLGERFALLLVVPAFALGCDSEDGPTYSRDVAEIMSENCVSCHRAGGVAPFALTDYESVRSRAELIAEVTAAREMPPMPVDNSGSCNTYSNARWLSDREIEKLGAWADAGAPEGDSSFTPPPPEPLPELGEADAVLDIGVEYLPRNDLGSDDYRCFVVSAPVTDGAFLAAYEVLPGDDRVVHHVIVYQPWSAEAVADARALDDAEEGAGYTCFGSSLIDAAPLALWAPGSGAISLPAGTGVPLAADRELVVQIHYNLEHGTHPDRTRVTLRFADEPVIPAAYLDLANGDFVLPPGREYVESSATSAFEEPVSFTVHGAMPHMHTLGRTLHAEAEASGESRCLVNVDRWNFHWQNAWWYDTALKLEDVSALSISCGFDTRSRTDTVTWGDSTKDEMCISYFYVTTQAAPDPEIVCDNAENPLFGSCLEALLDGCYEPDLSGECSVEDSTLTWSDGSRIEQAGDTPGLYGAGDEAPCIELSVEDDGAHLTRGEEELLYQPSDDGIVIGCPDATSVAASGFQLREFFVCRGLACPE